MKLLSWNVNGIRATHKKGFMDWFRDQDADVVFIQETKAMPDQIPDEVTNAEGYFTHFESGIKKGYSGTGLFSKKEPLNIRTTFGIERFDNEGRIICAEYPEFVAYGIYFPNGQKGEERLQYKMEFYDAFLEDAESYRKQGKPVIITGDVNTAHKEIDLARPGPNKSKTGFLDIERAWIDKLLDHGYYDSLRLKTDEGELYSYWDQRFRARDRNVGWRIDYFFVSEDLKDKVTDAYIQMEVTGSDHAPVGLELAL